MTDIRLIVCDFDGTIIGRQDEHILFERFRDQLRRLKEEKGTLWAVSTGRSSDSFWRCFGPISLFGMEPDVVITRHAYITGGRLGRTWRHVLWNLRIHYLLLLTRARIRFTLRNWLHEITDGIRGAHPIALTEDRLCVRFDTREACDVAVDMLNGLAAENRHLMVFKYLNEVDVRSVPFTKGLAVAELARHLGIAPGQILVIGNGHNDLSMMQPDVAGMVGCPMNSEAEVMEHVHRVGGHIAGRPSLEGVIETIDAAVSGSMNSMLPEWWRPASVGVNPRPARRHRQKWPKGRKARIALVIGVIYIVLLVFCEFGLIPKVGGVIRWPFTVLSGFVESMGKWL